MVKQRSFFILINDLVIGAGDIGHNVLDPAVQNEAQIVDCRRIQRALYVYDINKFYD